MNTPRRKFIKKVTAGVAGMSVTSVFPFSHNFTFDQSESGSINPWIELSKEAYLKNAETISKMAKGNQIMAVLKNNAYGLGDVEVAKILDTSPHIHGFAMVKDSRCLSLRKSGVKKPILLMGDFSESLGEELIASNITLSIFSRESVEKILSLSVKTSHTIRVQLYFDTGLGRMGMPHHEPLDWAKELLSMENIEIDGMFSTLTTPEDFAIEQLQRFKELKDELQNLGVVIKNTHIAPSLSMLQLQDSHLDLVRPGILLHGSFPIAAMSESKNYPLQPTFRLRARVIRMEKLRKGDTIGFSRFYELPQDEWIATISIGWADGYNSGAENGAKVLIGDKLFPVVNVNASHCNVCVGTKKLIDVGAVATLIGPDRDEITPEGFAKSINGHNYLQINYKESIPKIVSDDFI
ncbi:alanine racemase [Flagellimonas nanhaiensis]|uniref:Alanine racemase n=1 Tax=Flagellimonas nanhaiensis TaxID=2292706 RepID=A0A371JV37_9FLAO|nr:alanine racemase [Allomuricauda nanhaiensis]RDY61674.1 alanine racemase [Allomuricauda nanhaiensis]